MPGSKIKLRTLLLSVLLCAIITSSALIIWFTYEKYAQSIHEQALLSIDRAGARMEEKINCVLGEIEALPSIGIRFYKLFPEINPQNSTLITFFLGILKHDPHLFAFYIGLPDGKYLLAIDLNFYPVAYTTFAPVPHSAAYVVLMPLAGEGNQGQTRVFYDADFHFLSTQEAASPYDPRTRPWYTGAEKAKGMFWTDPYTHFYIQTDPGLTLAAPFYDPEGNLLGIFGADLALNPFSEYLAQQSVSKRGKTFILNESGQILLPKNAPDIETDVKLAAQAFEVFKRTKEHNFSYSFEKETVLASFHNFFASAEKEWSILFIAPLSDFLAPLLKTQKEAVYLSLAILAVAALLVVVLSLHIARPIIHIRDEIDRIARLDLEEDGNVGSYIEEISGIETAIASMRAAFSSFAHYIPKELAKRLMQKEHRIVLGGEKKTISIFFTDIADFTSIAEANPVEEVDKLLTEYFELLTGIIVKCGGTIDKYIGDSIMSIWGAPDDLPDYASRACTAALLCRHSLFALNEKRKKRGQPVFETRMGIKTGPVIVGNFGTAERMNYSAVGDAVNTAARLQALNKAYGTKILVGEETIKTAGSRFLARPLEIVEIRGKKIRIKVFELMGKIGGEPEIEPSAVQKELCARFIEAFDAFQKGDLPQAKRLFQEIVKRFPDDLPSRLYLEKIDRK